MRAVTFVPFVGPRPTSGLVLVPIVIEMAGSSTVMSGSGTGFSASARVSPMVISGMPATAMMSPGPALSAGLRSRASVMSSSVILTRCWEPSWRHHMTCWPLVMVPLCTRSSARRPRKLDASRLVTCAWSGASSSKVGAGIVSRIVAKSASRSSPSGRPPSAGRSREARPALAEA